MGIDVDDIAADGLCGGECQGEVLVFGVQGQTLLVDRTLVYGVGAREIHHLAKKKKKKKKLSQLANGEFFFGVGTQKNKKIIITCKCFCELNALSQLPNGEFYSGLTLKRLKKKNNNNMQVFLRVKMHFLSWPMESFIRGWHSKDSKKNNNNNMQVFLRVLL